MSWILQNKFLSALIASTVVLSGLLLYMGVKASSRYDLHLTEFQEASAQVASYERLALYPNQENLDGKTKALADYEQSIGEFVAGFEKFRVDPAARISPQQFSNRLVTANEKISSRLSDSGVSLPQGFFSGFEDYTGALAQSEATAPLSQQLEILDTLFEDLAEAKPAVLVNFLREKLPEETGSAYDPKEGSIARPHSFEITFQGTEASARKFITSLVDTNRRFAVIRVLRITNESTAAPKSSSAQFTSAAPAAVAAGVEGVFAGFFDDDPADAEEGQDAEAPAGEEMAPIQPIPLPVAPQEGTRTLGQVAGNEMVRVFIRFDVLEFRAEPSATKPDES